MNVSRRHQNGPTGLFSDRSVRFQGKSLDDRFFVDPCSDVLSADERRMTKIVVATSNALILPAMNDVFCSVNGEFARRNQEFAP
jgi:hypothetical protein